jgi:murein L,D-transpeptidase YcbB/YkuD
MLLASMLRAVLAAIACALFTTFAAAQDVAELIRQRVEVLRDAGALDVLGEPIASRTVLPRLYENRGFEPTWRSIAQIDSLLTMLEQSHAEGLDPDDYHAGAVRAARASLSSFEALAPVERAALDILLTDSVIRLGYHLRFGKVDPVALDPHWNLSRDLMGEDAVETLQAAIDSEALPEFAAEVIPRVFLYERFAKVLAEYRAIESAGGWGTVPAGATLKLGMSDDRVPALAARLAATRDLPASIPAGAATLYDDDLAAGVRRFQARHGLSADGAVGPATIAALNVPVAARVAQLRANLERARWVFYDPESEFLVVNIAGFRLYLVRRGEVVWRTRVQVGRPYRQTPVFRSAVSYLVFNPTWTVPPTIFRQDILPQVRRDPGYLAGRNIDVLDRSGARVEPVSVDWAGRSFPYQLVQRPGADNALGRVKFMFPNEHAVYLHDTPSRDLFERDSRAFSSGCIRVEDPYALAEILLGDAWPRSRLDALVAAGRTETVFLPKPMTLMLLYWTAEVDADGRVTFYPDVYERDGAVIAALDEPFRAPATL